MDVDRLEPPVPGSPREPTYATCGWTRQGLSVGWADTYFTSLPDQWIDLGHSLPPDGNYVLRSVADPSNRLYESPRKSDPARESDKANAAITYFNVDGRTIRNPDTKLTSPLGRESWKSRNDADSLEEQLHLRGYY